MAVERNYGFSKNSTIEEFCSKLVLDFFRDVDQVIESGDQDVKYQGLILCGDREMSFLENLRRKVSFYASNEVKKRKTKNPGLNGELEFNYLAFPQRPSQLNSFEVNSGDRGYQFVDVDYFINSGVIDYFSSSSKE